MASDDVIEWRDWKGDLAFIGTREGWEWFKTQLSHSAQELADRIDSSYPQVG